MCVCVIRGNCVNSCCHTSFRLFTFKGVFVDFSCRLQYNIGVKTFVFDLYVNKQLIFHTIFFKAGPGLGFHKSP